VSPQEIDEAVTKLATSLRDGTKELFQTLLNNDVPVLIFSAGLGNTVISVLKHYDVYLPNIKVLN
jgi:2-hydroxy-3-keto-5-methylthiopentenyl-1-phosphate phosphatase